MWSLESDQRFGMDHLVAIEQVLAAQLRGQRRVVCACVQGSELYIDVYIYLYLSIYLSMYLSIDVFVYIYLYTHIYHFPPPSAQA